MYDNNSVFSGRYVEVAEIKQHALDERYANNPERFVRGRPMVIMPPSVLAINPVPADEDGSAVDDRVNFPTLTAAGYVNRH